MTATLVAFATVVPFVFLFLRRRANRRLEEVSSTERQAANNITGERSAPPVVEIECFEDRIPLETEDITTNEVGAELGKERLTALSAIGPESQEFGLEVCNPAIDPLHGTTHSTDRSERVPLEKSNEIPAEALPQNLIDQADSPMGGLLPTGSTYRSPTAEATLENSSTGSGTAGLEGEYPQTATSLLDGESAVTDTGVEEAQPLERLREPGSERITKAPLRYRPPVQRPPQQANTRPIIQAVERVGRGEFGLEMLVRLKFDRFNFCEITLLPERTADLDTEIAVKSSGLSVHLVSQEDWFQDLPFENIGEYLRQGLELRGVLADKRRVRWRLSGRDVYVLASHPRASYFVSTTRLALGRSHIVLCVLDQIEQIEALLSEAGCHGYTKLDQPHGVPSGWVVLRGVAPTIPILLDPGVDPYYALKPAPELEIELEGGVCLRNSVWLAGYPPQIKLLGELNGAVKVLIDGKPAEREADGSFVGEGSELVGPHTVYCEGSSLSRSYSIEEPPEVWEAWPAYHFSQADICGPLVRLTPEANNRRAFSVPMSNPLLLGAKPGQIFYCSSRSVARWRGFVPFDVIWALPAQPLHCDKNTSVILQFSDAAVIRPKTITNLMLAWSTAILDASRKGLRIESEFPGASNRWREYKKVARSIRRSAR